MPLTESASQPTPPDGAVTAQATLPVKGMTCAACQAFVQRTLESQAGVRTASVNLMMERATVEYDPLTVSPQALVAAINETGYEASLPEPGRSATAEQDEQEREHETAYRRLRAQTAGALASAVVAMTLSMPLMRHGTVDPMLHRITMWLDAPVQAMFPALYTLPADGLRWTLLLLSVAVMLFAGRRFYVKAWAAARHRTSDMNTLIAVGTGAAFLYSAAVTLAPAEFEARGVAPEVYFEAVIFILALVLAGNVLEARARRGASSAMRALAALQPATARVERNGVEIDTPLDRLQLGDIVVVRPGERVPADAVVLTGASGVDESMLTGEPEPVDKQFGSALIGGTTNGQGVLRARITALGGETMLEKVLRLLRAAQSGKAPMQRLADRVSAVFVPVVFGLSLLTLAIWIFAGHDLARAASASVAVLIIACPCAMGLAVPTAVMVATGRAAQMGILVCSGEALERMASIDTVVFDKTGTLTEGRPEVVAVTPAEGWTKERLLQVVASVEKSSEHPLGAAVMREAERRGIALLPVVSFAALAGLGAVGSVEGQPVIVGRRSLLEERAVPVPAELEEPITNVARPGGRAQAGGPAPQNTEGPAPQNGGAPQGGEAAPQSAGRTVIWAAMNGRFMGCVSLSDRPRPGARAVVKQLRGAGLRVVMLTGDQESPARVIARELGIDEVVAGVLPEGKLETLRRFQAEGRKAAMVGDGINDAPALAAAHVGVALASGTDVAREAADLTLMRPDLGLILQASALARSAVRLMKQNLFWALAYNAVCIPVAAGVLYPAFGILLSPVIASAAMALSSVSVVSNSLRLAAWRRS
jgi:P-type Cu+ transporter